MSLRMTCGRHATSSVSASRALVQVFTSAPVRSTTVLIIWRVSTSSSTNSTRKPSSDRNSAIIENGGTTEIFQSRDAQDRITYRQEDNSGANAKQTWYGFTGAGDDPDFVRRADWTITEKYLQLPGGVLLTIRPTLTGNAQKVYSLNDLHGDTMVTTDAAGTQATSFRYDPFGSLLSTTGLPNNAPVSTDYGWEGQHQRVQETDIDLKPIEMGARVYIPVLGRFLSVDSVQGGTENNYVYPLDPVNDSDIAGTFSWKATIKVVTVVASVGSLIPGPIGMAASGVAAVGYAIQGDYTSAVMYGAGIALSAVGAGAGVGIMKASSKSVIAAEDVGKLYKVAEKEEQVVSITGYTKHGINQAIDRDGVGVSVSAIHNAVNSPEKVIKQPGGVTKFVGKNATVVLNKSGKVITTWATHAEGYRIK